MKRNTQLEKQAKRIADAIVELVELTDGPVTLAQVERDVAGFAKEEPPFWRYGFKTGRFYWNGMTEAGEKALEQVMHERRVTVQFVSLLPYILEDCLIKDDNWQPIVLLPARAANLDSPTFLVRASQDCVSVALATPGWQSLEPGPVSFTADQFSL